MPGLDNMDGITIAWVLGTLITVLMGVISWLVKSKHTEHAAMWRKMDAQSVSIAEAEKKAASDLAAYKLYVAENYVSVKTFEKFEDRVLKALDDLKEAVLHHKGSVS